MISPYARENYVGHQQVSFDSVLRFAEWKFGLGGKLDRLVTGLRISR